MILCIGHHVAVRAHVHTHDTTVDQKPMCLTSGDGNCTVALSDAGIAAFGRYDVVNATLVDTDLFYANGPVRFAGMNPGEVAYWVWSLWLHFERVFEYG